MTSVLQRIQARIDVLQDWLDHGVPLVVDEDGRERPAYVPTSLTKARTWHDETLEIEKVGDPNSFTTTHPRHGSKVEELERLLKQMKAAGSIRRAPAKSTTDQLKALRQEHSALQKQHIKVVSQLAAAREELQRERTQRLSVQQVLAAIRRRERGNAERAGKALLAAVPTTDGE